MKMQFVVNLNTVGKKIFGAPRMWNSSGAIQLLIWSFQSAKILLLPSKYKIIMVLSNHSNFQYCDSNIGLFSIAPCKVITLNPLYILFLYQFFASFDFLLLQLSQQKLFRILMVAILFSPTVVLVLSNLWFSIKMVLFLLLQTKSVFQLCNCKSWCSSLLCLNLCMSFVDWFMASFLSCFPYSYRSSNHCDSNSCHSFMLLKSLAKSNGNLFAIAFKSKKEKQPLLSR